MKSVAFSITRVNHLRRAAVRARTLLAERPDRRLVQSPSNGWFAYGYDANDLVRVVDTLRLKAGFAPHAYDSGGSISGVIWAVPADAPLDAPGEWARLEDTWLPRPPGAVPLMQAIEGDGSPWSYLSASILSREATEFGARWPGYVWTGQTILSKPPCQADDPDVADDERKPTGDTPVGQLDVAPRCSSRGSQPMPRGERPGRSSCTSVIPSVETGSTKPRTPIPLAATIARPGPRCCARARGGSSTDRCPSRVAGDQQRPTVSKFTANPGLRQGSGRRRSGSHGCGSCETPFGRSGETPPPHAARTAV